MIKTISHVKLENERRKPILKNVCEHVFLFIARVK